ncbi:MAG: Flp pilus assembly complex ATPase component TadA [Kiritimatiellae bacterium]|nr:Flp pilus assembly complex ATPase component TadA [Kiritimatiellia bacterium]
MAEETTVHPEERPVLRFDPVLDIAIENGIIDNEQALSIQEEHDNSGKATRDIIIEQGYLSEDDLLGMLAGYMGTDIIDLAQTDIPVEVRAAIPAAVARAHMVVPVEVGQHDITLAAYTVIDTAATDELGFVLSKDVRIVLARKTDIEHCVNEFYGDDSATVADMLTNLEDIVTADSSLSTEGTIDEKDIEAQAGSEPVIRFVNLVLYQAVKDRASDIHFEPFEKEFRIRYRVDGALYEMQPPPRRLAVPIISRVKVLANLNIAERRIPQDGRIPLTVAGHQVDLRVSCLPTQFGESVVLRVLDRNVVALDIDNIGLPDDILEDMLIDIEKPNGIVIVTGPTGSGKTATLYSCLKKINTPDSKLLTAEEPVEYDMDGIIQVPINPLVGNTFAAVLRAFLRQDPDVMMIGEIRDFETAEIAIQASLTGHLVFSTLHTNDAAGAVTRLVDMGVAPYLVSSTLEAVLAQRLVRTNCKECKTPYEPDDEVLRRLSMTREQIGNRSFYYGRGCQTCNNTGYKGRKGIFEYLRVSSQIRDMINEKKPTLLIRERARELGMRTMREDGVRNILDGYTTVDEILRYT